MSCPLTISTAILESTGIRSLKLQLSAGAACLERPRSACRGRGRLGRLAMRPAGLPRAGGRPPWRRSFGCDAAALVAGFPSGPQSDHVQLDEVGLYMETFLDGEKCLQALKFSGAMNSSSFVGRRSNFWSTIL